MSQSDGNRTLLRFPGEQREFSVTRPSTHDFAMLEELSFVRREAQAEATVAYEQWRLWPGDETYAVYRAAQDRADAAQDELARWTKQLAQ
jgi:acyl-CoA reductase-like NAD-dependent aldehyde dehydrogenase